MKKFLCVLVMGMMLALIPNFVLADAEFGDPGYYQHSITGAIKYFNKHPGSPSQWIYLSEENGNGNGNGNGDEVNCFVEGKAWQWNQYHVVGDWTQKAGGWNYSEGYYYANGCLECPCNCGEPNGNGEGGIAFGYAGADGATYALKGWRAKTVIGWVGGNYDVDGPYKAAGACGWNKSWSIAFGEDVFTSVYGDGLVYHSTYNPGPTGGGTFGVASWEYMAYNDGEYLSYSYGGGGGCTGGITWRSSYPHGMGSHARSFSIAGSYSGGGSID